MKTSKQRAVRTAQQGFTLIELLVVIGIIAILATVVLVAINPARQFKQANDTQRVSNVNALLNAIGQNIADNRGTFKCSGTPRYFATTTAEVEIANTSLYGNIYDCLVPDYISALPKDPTTGSDVFISSDYHTGYFVGSTTQGRIVVWAKGELTNPISVTR